MYSSMIMAFNEGNKTKSAEKIDDCNHLLC
jgi:hypothetical protein